MSKHYEVIVTTVESFSIHADNEEEAIDLTQEKMSHEQGTLIDTVYEATESLSESQEMDQDEERAGKVYNERGEELEFDSGLDIGFAHKDIKKEREDDES